jgi:TRAP-type C4-dicarboxylate transport system substrate-binding protein
MGCPQRKCKKLWTLAGFMCNSLNEGPRHIGCYFWAVAWVKDEAKSLHLNKERKERRMNMQTIPRLKVTRTTGVLILSFLVILNIAIYSNAWGKDTMTLKLGTYYSTTDVRHGQTEYFVQKIAERTNGKVKIEIYPGQQLAKAKEAVNAVAGGAIDMYLPWASHYAGTFPIFDSVCQPLVYPTFEAANGAMNEITKLLDSDFQKHGIKVVLAYAGGTLNIFSTKKLYKTTSDLNGQKMAGVGGAIDRMLKSFGAGVVSITSPERYLALQRKIVDATITTNATFWSSRLYEVAPFVTVIDSPWPAHFLVINLTKWKGFPQEVRDAFVDSRNDMQAHTAETFKQLDQKIYSELPSKGAEVFKASDSEKKMFRDSLITILEDHLNKQGKLGKEALKIIKKFSQ